MHTTNLRKVGGSVMLTVPPAIMEMLGMASGMKVNMAVESGRLVIEPESRREYTLAGLLAQCDGDMPISGEDREWLSEPACGRELL